MEALLEDRSVSLCQLYAEGRKTAVILRLVTNTQTLMTSLTPPRKHNVHFST